MLTLSHFSFKTLKGDFFGALTSTVVALPFALAFGVSSGLGASSGIYCAILTGFFASLFGGTNQQITGPNTGLTVAMTAIITEFMTYSPENGAALAFSVVVLAGFFQILFGLFKLGKYFTLISYPVISGFTSGIGVLIILSQLSQLFGQPLSYLLIDPVIFTNTNILLAAACLLLLFWWPEKYNNIIPASIVALIGATIYFLIAAPSLPVIGAITSEFPPLSLPTWDVDLSEKMIKSALLIATLSTLDSLMTSLTVDSLSDELHDSDQELTGQGIGNMIAGLFGALPGGGATMRTITNLRAGGTTPISGMLHAIFILIIVSFAGEYTAYIPVAVLSAILIKVGLNIIDWNFLSRFHQIPPFSVFLMLLTMTLSVTFDLVSAVVVGVFLANMVTIRRLSEIQLDNLKLYPGQSIEQLPSDEKLLFKNLNEQVLLLKISGPISFGVARTLKQSIGQVASEKIILIDFSEARFVGITSTIAIEEIIVKHLNNNGVVLLANLNNRVRKSFKKLKMLEKIGNEHIFVSCTEALKFVSDIGKK